MGGPEGLGDPGDIAALLILLEKGKVTVQQAAEKLRGWLDERRYGIVPSPEEYEELKRIGEQAEYEDLAEHASANQKKIIRMGLRLRELEGDEERVEQFKESIERQFGGDAIYLAQAVQARAAMALRHTLVASGCTDSELHDVMSDFLHHPRRYVLLATRRMSGREKKEAQEANAYIRQYSPVVFAVGGSGTAQDIAAEIAGHLSRAIPTLYEQRIIEGEQKQLIVFARPP